MAQEGPLSKILVAVVIALLVGGSSPWWWAKVFPPKPTPDPATSSTPAPTSAAPPYMGELLYNVNFQGSDIHNSLSAQTEGECSDACLQNARCKAMTFVKHPNGVGGVCWLKDAVPAQSRADNMVSSVKVFP